MITALRGFHLLTPEQQVAIARDLEGQDVTVHLHYGRVPQVLDGPVRARLVAVAYPISARGRPLLILAHPGLRTARAISTYWVRDLRAATTTAPTTGG